MVVLWTAGKKRQQLAFFAERLDDAVPGGHAVLLLYELLGRLDSPAWETTYQHVPSGQPPLHPRVSASVILYGLLVKSRASLKMEAARK